MSGNKTNKTTGPKTAVAVDVVARPTRPVKKESLNPRHIAKPPASHATRLAILTKLHEAMAKLNDLVRKHAEPSKKALVLSEDELVAMALDEEEWVAKENFSVYSNIIKLRIVRLKKMTQQDWEENVLNYLRPKGLLAEEQPKPAPEKKVSTGLTAKEEMAVLSKLVARPEALAKLGVVTAVPTAEEIRIANSGAEAGQGWEKCDRCGGRFQVFPGRREDGLLASGGPCTYHYAKPFRPARQRTDHIVGQKDAYYPCCNETVGTSTGCTKSDWHVFKVTDPKRLASLLQFEKTPHQPDKGFLPPGYTTRGLELIRLTAISWPAGEKLVDVLVRPIGEILDLNSRFSGIRPEQFANAPRYGAARQDGESSDPTALEIVDSPSEARSLLFAHLQPETPLIAHAIENDLNACRIVHPTIVDTALLYPHPAGLPIKFGLRMLTKKYLDRAIQVGGGTQGHDSLEDAKATGDLVRLKVGETWKALKRAGWTIEDGKLAGPAKATAKPSASGTQLRVPGAGVKRSAPEE
jgi:hypothetical protein